MNKVKEHPVIEAIRAAFPLQPVPKRGLFQSHAGDQLYFRKISEQEYDAAAARDGRRTWPEYRDVDLKALDCAMAHLVPEEFVYFLPAYLCAAVRELESGEGPDGIEMIVTNACSQITSREEYSLMRYQPLNPAQRQAVVQFLEHVAASRDLFNSVQARKALDRFWLRYALAPP